LSSVGRNNSTLNNAGEILTKGRIKGGRRIFLLAEKMQCDIDGMRAVIDD